MNLLLSREKLMLLTLVSASGVQADTVVIDMAAVHRGGRHTMETFDRSIVQWFEGNSVSNVNMSRHTGISEYGNHEASCPSTYHKIDSWWRDGVQVQECEITVKNFPCCEECLKLLCDFEFDILNRNRACVFHYDIELALDLAKLFDDSLMPWLVQLSQRLSREGAIEVMVKPVAVLVQKGKQNEALAAVIIAKRVKRQREKGEESEPKKRRTETIDVSSNDASSSSSSSSSSVGSSTIALAQSRKSGICLLM